MAGCTIYPVGVIAANKTVAGTIRELARKGTAIVTRVGVDRCDEMGVQTSIE